MTRFRTSPLARIKAHNRCAQTYGASIFCECNRSSSGHTCSDWRRFQSKTRSGERVDATSLEDCLTWGASQAEIKICRKVCVHGIEHPAPITIWIQAARRDVKLRSVQTMLERLKNGRNSR